MKDEGREDRRELDRLRARFETEEDQIEALLRDLRAMKAGLLIIMGKLHESRRRRKLQKATAHYQHLVARERRLTEGLARMRGHIADLEANIACSEELEA